MEIKIKKIEEENFKCGDQIENFYKSERMLTEEIKTVNKTNKDLNQHVSKVSSEKEAIRKQFENYKRMEHKKILEKSDLVDILEHTLENRNSEICRLKEKLEDVYKLKEECERNQCISGEIESQDSESNIATTSSKNRLACEHCEYVSSHESCMESHVKKNHVWECKYCDQIFTTEDQLDEHVDEKHECQFCDMKTKTRVELQQHKRQKHEIKCKLCMFETWNNRNLGDHMIEKHEYSSMCNTCGFAFKMESKLSDHICKVELKNPKFDTLYTRDWYNANGCNAVYCTTQNRDVAMIHADKCWSDKVKCFWPRKEKTFVKHFQLEKVIKNEEIHWETLLEEIKPTFIRLIDSHTNLEQI